MVTQAQILNYATTAHNEYKKLENLAEKYHTIKKESKNLDDNLMKYIIKTYGNPFKADTDGDHYVETTEKKIKMLDKKLSTIVKENKQQAYKCNALYEKLNGMGILDNVSAVEKQKYKTTHIKIYYIPADEIRGLN